MDRVRGYFFGGLLTLLGLGFCLPQADAGELLELQRAIQETAGRLQKILRDERLRLIDDPGYVYRLVDEVFLPHVDMTGASRLVLGRHWRKATTVQKQAFAEEFKRLLVRTYATALREMGDWEVEFLPLRMKPGAKSVLVQSRLIRAGAQPVAVDYRMHRKDDSWLAYDVKIEGVSLITNYRSSFSRLIRQKGLGALIEELATRNDEKAPAARDKVAAKSGVR